MTRDRFGFLPCDWSIKFHGGDIHPLPEFYKVRTRVEKHTNQDGFLYPPRSYTVRLDPTTKKRLGKVPGSERPALLHPVPLSHELSLTGRMKQEDLRKGPGAFLIHLLAYLFGIRLQFHDWWFDSRIPIKSTHNVYLTEAVVNDFISHCYRAWQGWPRQEQMLITNILYMHSRAPLYEWDWERFAMEYMVLDGCWRLAELPHGIKGKLTKPHSQRISRLCQKFGIPYDGSRVGRIVALRNNLFHQTLWDGSQPCTSVNPETFLQPNNLRRLNQRLIPALFGYHNQYVRSLWWSMGSRFSIGYERPIFEKEWERGKI